MGNVEDSSWHAETAAVTAIRASRRFPKWTSLTLRKLQVQPLIHLPFEALVEPHIPGERSSFSTKHVSKKPR